MDFLQRKENQLEKEDKSDEGKWDDHIKQLCEKINTHEEYYTTSSCAGRVTLTKNHVNKSENSFLFKSHEKISFDELKNALVKATTIFDSVLFKQESCILSVACDNLENAEKLMEKAQSCGWKRSGIISFTTRVVVELMSTEKFEFPIVQNSKILVDDHFLRIIVEESNKKLEKTWEKIEKFVKFF